ncbi:MAG TPA: CBS domain-containing protein [Terriglobales bacterium]|nr:CBS domain-containing protein [Terriglobales bacterium]
MEQIFDLVKNREVYFVDTGRTILDTVRYMVERNIGAVAVVVGDELVGIFSERDLMKRVVSEARDPAATMIKDVMTEDPLVVSPHERIDECMRLMKEHNFRHLPVCDGRKLKGLISLRDLIVHDLEQKDGENQVMRAYISQAS